MTLQIQPEAGGSRIVMDEHAADRRSLILFNPLGEPLVRVRNAESLRRLRRLAEGAEQIPGGALPPRGAATDAAITGSSAPASV